MVSALAGLLAGLVHALSGPDHLAAIAPLALDGSRGRKVWSAGLLWGIGHSAGVCAVGLLALALRGVLPIDRLSSWGERLVGAVLVAIGLWGLRKAFLRWAARHRPHPAAGPVAEHDHGHQHAPAHGRTAFWVGGLHGLAGSSHILGLFPALALPLPAASAYIGGFGVGTVLAMAAFSSVLGLAATRLAGRTGAYPLILGAASAAAIVVGGVWLVR